MDPLAHTLLGATMAESGLRDRSPLATATLLVGVNLPDVDALVTVLGTDASLHYRRGVTHGVLSMVVSPLMLCGLVLLWDRYMRRKRAPDRSPARFQALLPLAYLSVLSHPLLDWLNNYGVRLLSPFTNEWFYGDSVFIVDPWLWLLLAASVVLARSETKPTKVAWLVLALLASALVTAVNMVPPIAKVAWLLAIIAMLFMRVRTGALGSGKRLERIRFTARVCLLVVGVYVVGAVSLTHHVQRLALEALRADGVVQVVVAPSPARPLAREVIAVTASEYRFYDYDWFTTPPLNPTEAAPMLRGERSAAVERALIARPGMAQWMRLPAFHEERTPFGVRVRIEDARYARSSAPIGRAVVELADELE